jgi:UDP-glucose 4-epimerase
MVIPRFIEQAKSGADLTVYGDGSQSRCFGHVLDVVPAIHRLAHCDEAVGQVVNLGSDQEVTITHLAERVRDRVGSSSKIRLVPYDIAYRAGFEDMQRRVPNLAKARRLIGYEPRRTLDDAIDDIIKDGQV